MTPRHSALCGLAVLAAWLAPTPAFAQDCDPDVGKPGTIAGKVTGAAASDGKAVYDLYVEDADAPCFAQSFEFDDPSGKVKCQEGQTLKGSGVIAFDDNTQAVSVVGTDYSCQ
jgi:hypothetical protein